MTPEFLEQHFLSTRYWIKTSLVPSVICLLLALLIIRVATVDRYDLNHAAVILAFFAIFFVLVRGGHIYMIRTMHFDLMKTYAGVYPKKLKQLPKDMRRQNLGFALARIKSELIHQKRDNS